MCASKAIHALCQGHQPQKTKSQKSTSQCPNCTHSHSPGYDNCSAQNTTCNGCSKRGHRHAKCHSSGATGKHATKPDGAVKTPHHWCQEKGKRADIIQVSTKETPPCDKLFADTVNYGSAGDTHLEEIVIDAIHDPRCNKAYATVKLPASISSKGTASLHVKVDTRAGSNVLPLHVQALNVSTWTGSAQLAWIMSAPGSLPITDPIYCYMAHSVAPLSGSQVALAFDLTRSIHIGLLWTHPVLPS